MTPPRRTHLINRGVSVVTPDTAAAMSDAESRAKEAGWLLDWIKPDPPAPKDWKTSMIPGGREVWVRAVKVGVSDPLVQVAATFSFLVPAGFTPWLRYAIPAPGCERFQFFGPWGAVADRAFAAGAGHYAWPSACAAALVDVGAWDGPDALVRFVQAQAHRLGLDVGPVDGKAGAKLSAALEALGLGRLSLDACAVALSEMDPAGEGRAETGTGKLVVQGRSFAYQAHGGVVAAKTAGGIQMSLRGPGRLVVDFGG